MLLYIICCCILFLLLFLLLLLLFSSLLQVLGTPTREEISAMNSNYTEFKFPQIKACQWRKVFRSKTPEDAIDFIGSMLAYSPEERVRPIAGCTHTFFDELRDPACRLPNGRDLPPLFDFTKHEVATYPELMEKLHPEHARVKANEASERLQASSLAQTVSGGGGGGGEAGGETDMKIGM